MVLEQHCQVDFMTKILNPICRVLLYCSEISSTIKHGEIDIMIYEYSHLVHNEVYLNVIVMYIMHLSRAVTGRVE